jgi:hypothetical protein
MPFFLFVALTALACYYLIMAGRPAWVELTRRRVLTYRVLIIVLPCLVALLGGWALFRSVYPAYGISFFIFDVALTRKVISGLILGTALAICLGALFGSLSAGRPYRELTTKEKVLTTLIPVVLILGLGGEELISDAGSRVSKLSFGGAEIAFRDAPKEQRARESSGPPASLYTSQTLSSPSLPLDMFSLVSEFLKGDLQYVELAYNNARTKNPSASAIPVGLLSELTHAKEFAEIIARPIGTCLVTIFNQTGDIGFVRSVVEPLLSPLRDVTLPNHMPAQFAADTSAALRVVLRMLFTYTYERVYMPSSIPSDAGAGRKFAVAKLRAECSRALHLLCTQGSWETIRDELNKSGSSDTVDETRMKEFEKEFEECKKRDVSHHTDGTMREGELETYARVRKPADDCDERSAKSPEGRGGSGNHSTACRHPWAIEPGVRAYLENFAREENFRMRPYMHILIATIYSQFGQDPSALVYLENWLIDNAEWANAKSEYVIASKWMRIRALSVMSALMDEWISRDRLNTSLVLREFHIRRLRLSLSLADEIFDYGSALVKVRGTEGTENWERTAFSSEPNETGECPVKEMPKLFVWYVFSLIRMTDHELQSSKYPNHAPEVHKNIRELLATKLGCSGAVDPGYPRQFRAETLRLYAQMQLQDVRAMQNVAAKASLDVLLENGMHAANLGLYLVGDAEAKLTEKLTDPKQPEEGQTRRATPEPILERLAPVDLITSYEGLLVARAQIQHAKTELNRD